MKDDVKTMCVYRLEPLSISGMGDGFKLVDTTSLLGTPSIYHDFANYDPEQPGQRDRKNATFVGRWIPREVTGKIPEHLDYTTIWALPVFSLRAVGALRDILEANGEILPLRMPAGMGPFYTCHVTTTADVLDASRSQIRYAPIGQLALGISWYEFRAERMADLTVFRLPERLHDIYVTETFVARAREHNLQGFDFRKVWPLPPGTDWEKLAQAELERMPGRPKPPKPEEIAAGSQAVGRVTSRPFRPGEELDSVSKALQDYPKELGWDIPAMGVDEIQAKIHEMLCKIYSSDITKDEKLDRAFWLAFAWGETLVKELQWEWAMLEDEAGHKTPVVATPNRSHAVPVLQFIGKLATTQEDQTSLLLYNMIVANDLTAAKAGELRLLGELPSVPATPVGRLSHRSCRRCGKPAGNSSLNPAPEKWHIQAR